MSTTEFAVAWPLAGDEHVTCPARTQRGFSFLRRVISHPASIPPTAGGYIKIELDSFEEVIRCMTTTDPDATVKAIGTVLRQGWLVVLHG
jgi:hypothetical protein